MKRKYHYEYRLRAVDLCYGGATKGPFRTLSEAKSSRPIGPNKGMWMIEKFRVYE